MGWNRSDAPATSNKKRSGTGLPVKPLAIGVAVIVAIIAGALWFVGADSDDSAADKSELSADGASNGKLARRQKQGKRKPTDAVREALNGRKVARKAKSGNRPRMEIDIFAHLSGEDRIMAEAVQNALDNDDLAKTMAAATKALTSTNAEVRLNAIEALGWFGGPALPELTGAMADADEDVRQSAENQFELALNDIDDTKSKFDIAIAAFSTLSDEDQLCSLGGIVSNAATEMIDSEEDEEKQAETRLNVVQALVDIIDGSDCAQNVEAAKEAYNDITGNEWLGIEEAERYLVDPENYDPDAPGANQEKQDAE